jgi:L-threonylcarbamoyladenylate synthase
LPPAVDDAVAALLEGLVVAVPTDTVYGLAANPFHPGATARIFAAKRRPRDIELPMLVAGVDQALELCAVDVLSDAARRLMERGWPGALTLVVPRRPGLTADLGTDDATVGIRWPAHPVVVELCQRVGPLAVTSANLHRGETPATAEGVAALFGNEVALVVDGGVCAGAPSTVLDCTGEEPRLLRAGAVAWEAVLAASRP